MAKAVINLQKESGGIVKISPVDGIGITEVTVPESGELVTKEYVDLMNNLKTIASGTATFTATTNNINLTGIGIGVEIGDVIQISGADDSKNNTEFTVEVITDANNIIVNQAHANKGTTKNVAARAGDTGVTVKLLAKWYNASIGLGRAELPISLVVNTTRQNLTNRPILVNIFAGSGVGVVNLQNITTSTNIYATVGTNIISTGTICIGVGEAYKWVVNSGTPSNVVINEVR